MIKQVSIGCTVPSNVACASTKMETTLDNTNENDLYQIVNSAKYTLAELISGGDVEQFTKPLECMNHPTTSTTAESNKHELILIEQKVKQLRDQLERKRLEAKELFKRLEDYQVIEKLELLHLSNSFWGSLDRVMKDIGKEPDEVIESDAGDDSQNQDSQSSADISGGMF